MKSIIFLTTLILVALSCIAQPGGTPTGTPVPVDGGITLLLAAGGIYGIRKALKKKN